MWSFVNLCWAFVVTSHCCKYYNCRSHYHFVIFTLSTVLYQSYMSFSNNKILYNRPDVCWLSLNWLGYMNLLILLPWLVILDAGWVETWKYVTNCSSFYHTMWSAREKILTIFVPCIWHGAFENLLMDFCSVWKDMNCFPFHVCWYVCHFELMGFCFAWKLLLSS